MIAIFVRGASHRPIFIPTRVADTRSLQPSAGDFVSVFSIDGGVEYCIRLHGPVGPACWRGTILSIGREGVPAVVAQGIELDDVVEVDQSEMANLIHCQRIG
ncbi:hypothetical protein BKK81_09105 [Cupriavidus sp. USMAHM13]|uniref:hypothetical protein n=1 Tax=Cupriavidus sp. USMAHM13 TaxID=1389192 RepID=UPI0008A6CFB8|nr:hypothetical protein [Cupriavidus sp. USMAHM13]AOY99403.1 hypothetical protein BKK81_09105 [Cupriavidus sp. USMAHM13]